MADAQALMEKPTPRCPETGDLALSTRVFNCLTREGITTVAELVRWSAQDLADIRNLGRGGVNEIETELLKRELSLASTGMASRWISDKRRGQPCDHWEEPCACPNPPSPLEAYLRARAEVHRLREEVDGLRARLEHIGVFDPPTGPDVPPSEAPARDDPLDDPIEGKITCLEQLLAEEAWRAAERARSEENRERLAAQTQLDIEMRDRYVAGGSCREIGELYGVSGNRVNQRIRRVDPQANAKKRARRAELRKMAEEESRQARLEQEGVPCVTCGNTTLPRNGSGRQHNTCGDECTELYRALSNHIGQADRIFIRPGSAADVAASEVLRRHLPIFDLLSEPIRLQLTGQAPRIRSYHAKKPPTMRPCENCGEPTTNRQFCSPDCYKSSGRMGKPREVASHG